MNNNIDLLTVYFKTSIKDAIKKLDKGGIGFICVINDSNKVIGIVTDGDFRRAILNEVNLNNNILTIANRNYKYLYEDFTEVQLKNIFENTVIKQVPIIDKEGQLKKVITEESFYGIENRKSKNIINAEVVIMAGGKGTRLDPFTRILPKPLIPIGDKTILEIIIERFTDYGLSHFFISVNHKAKIIKSYFEEINPNYKISYLHEEKPLGTVGALKQLEGFSEREILLTNCDIIIKADYADLLKHHKEHKNDITIVASLKHYNIPYGICEIENGGKLLNIKEKPEYDLLVNTGMYVLNPNVLRLIPQDEFFHITNLIEKIKSTHKIGIYPISEESWIDTGEWAEYKNAVNKMSL